MVAMTTLTGPTDNNNGRKTEKSITKKKKKWKQNWLDNNNNNKVLKGEEKKMAVMAFIHTYKKEKKSYLPSHQFLHTLYFF